MAIKRVLLCVLATLLVLPPPGPAQRRIALDIDTIMRGPGLYGFEPQAVRWSGDGQRIYFQWKQAGDNPESPRDTYFIYRDRGAPVKLSDEDSRLAPPAFGVSTRDRTRAVYTQAGDVYIYDFPAGRARQLTRTAEAESNPHFTQDEKRVAFTRGGNLYLHSLDSGELEQLTEVKPFDAKPKPAEGSSQAFLERQEKELIQAVREKLRLKDAAEGKRKRENPRKPFELQARQTVAELRLCPGEKCVVAMIDEKADGSKPDNVPNYVTETGYTEELPGRTNVGDKQTHTRVAVLDAETGEAQWIETGLGDREVTYTLPLFNERGTAAVLVARAADNKDRWILALDTGSAKARVVFTEHDDAWLGGPG